MAAVHGFQVVKAAQGKRRSTLVPRSMKRPKSSLDGLDALDTNGLGGKPLTKKQKKRMRRLMLASSGGGGEWKRVKKHLADNVLGAKDALLPREIEFHRSTKPSTGYNTSRGKKGGDQASTAEENVSDEPFVPPPKAIMSMKPVLRVRLPPCTGPQREAMCSCCRVVEALIFGFSWLRECLCVCVRMRVCVCVACLRPLLHLLPPCRAWV